MMRPEDKAAWVAALRSGKYVQGSAALCLDDRHCCLGVQCELSGCHRSGPLVPYSYNTTVFTMEGDVGAELYPTQKMLEHWGLSQKKMFELAGMNDDGKTFAEIADAIEKDAEI